MVTRKKGSPKRCTCRSRRDEPLYESDREGQGPLTRAQIRDIAVIHRKSNAEIVETVLSKWNNMTEAEVRRDLHLAAEMHLYGDYTMAALVDGARLRFGGKWSVPVGPLDRPEGKAFLTRGRSPRSSAERWRDAVRERAEQKALRKIYTPCPMCGTEMMRGETFGAPFANECKCGNCGWEGIKIG